MKVKYPLIFRIGLMSAGAIGLLALVSCDRTEENRRSSTQSGAVTTSQAFSDCFTQYVGTYPDLISAYRKSGATMPLSIWGYNHYSETGRNEGRKLPDGCAEFARDEAIATSNDAESSPNNSGDSTATSSNVAVNQTCFAAYVDRYRDLASAYSANPGGLSKAGWGERHYTMFGRREGRILPRGCATSSPPKSTATGFSAGDYQLVYRLNASFTGGKMVRWKSRNISLQNFEAANVRDGVKPWTGFNFSLGNAGIIFKGDSNQFSGSCGWAIPYWYQNYEFARCDIWVNIATHVQGRCGSVASTITHEVGHCLGILAHTQDGSLMDATANGSTTISKDVRRMLDVLYATPLNSQVAATGSVSVGKELTDRGDMVKGQTIFVMPEDKTGLEIPPIPADEMP